MGFLPRFLPPPTVSHEYHSCHSALDAKVSRIVNIGWHYLLAQFFYMHFNMKWERCKNTAPFCVWTRLIRLKVRSCSKSPRSLVRFCTSKRIISNVQRFVFFQSAFQAQICQFVVIRLAFVQDPWYTSSKSAKPNSTALVISFMPLSWSTFSSCLLPLPKRQPPWDPNTSFAPHSLASGTMDATWTNKNLVLSAASVYPAHNS